MYELNIELEFAAAHNLLNYNGECERLHGHNWRVEIFVLAKHLDSAGLAIDFKVLKERAKSITNELDHEYLNELLFFKDKSPSSETIARYLFIKLSETLNDDNIKVSKVKVWESDRAAAAYFEEDASKW